ncbi:MAG TPA: MarR family transcriptional regulator [Sedimentisphaerales bacterium]|jgi:DNA-binding MarR family transcriptional regulator|nr:MarR family transcriptional regulator [Sedimentisphaerales bacterium]HNU31753.1 MarR family transcriptional regulator [Sedimentisphaerales bacterium]
MAEAMKQQHQGGFLVAKLHQLGGRIFARLLKEHGVDQINPAQGRIMFVLWREDGIPIHELARRTKLGKSTLTSMLDRLERAGMLERAPDPKDRRKILIRRTMKDKALERLYVQVSEEMVRIWYRGFTDEQIQTIERDLQRILDNLTDYETNAT